MNVCTIKYHNIQKEGECHQTFIERGRKEVERPRSRLAVRRKKNLSFVSLYVSANKAGGGGGGGWKYGGVTVYL